MIFRQHLRPVGDQQVRRPPGAALHFGKFAEQGFNVQRDAHADHVHHVRMEDAGRQQVQGELALVRNNGMSGVRAALKADNDIALTSQQIRNFPFSFVAPVGADNRSYHDAAFFPEK